MRGASLLQRLELEVAEVRWLRQIARALPAIRTPRRTADALICDIRLPDGTGEELHDTPTRISQPPPVLFITGQSSIDRAVRLIRSGAADHIAKPFDLADLLVRLRHVMRPHADRDMPSEIGFTDAARMIDRQTVEAAAQDTPPLIRGAPGPGRVRIARRVHALSDPRAAPCVVFDARSTPVGVEALDQAIGEEAHGLLILVSQEETAPEVQDRLVTARVEPAFRLISTAALRIAKGKAPVSEPCVWVVPRGVV